jgi:hypothetical protein
MDPLNTSPIASGSQMPPMSPEPQHKSSIGPVAGAIIVILLLIAGGLYFWGAQLNKQEDVPSFIPSQEEMAQEESTLQSESAAGLPAQSSSDDVSSIEADANAMNMNEFESQNSAELNNI